MTDVFPNPSSSIPSKDSFCLFVCLFVLQEQAWLQNVVNSPLLHSKQANSWVEVQSSTILFHSGGPMYPFGAGKYLEHLEQVVLL